MWVYTPPRQEAAKAKTETANAPQGDFPVAFSDEPSTLQPAPKAAAHPGQPALASRPPKKPLGICWRYWLAYALGAAAAGVTVCLCQPDICRFLLYYGSAWLELYRTQTPLHLFSTLFLSGVFSMTLLLLFGLCSFGTPAIYLLLGLQGMGSGLVSLQFFQAYGSKGMLLYLLLPAVSLAFLGWCLCTLSQFAAPASRALLRCCQKGAEKAEPPHTAVHQLLSKYLFLCTLQILSCGLNAVSAAPLLTALLAR